MNELYYRSSEKVSISGAIFLFLGTFLAGTILAIPYLFIVEICPIIYACILLTVAYGYVIGLLCKVIIEKTKMRNAMVTIFLFLWERLHLHILSGYSMCAEKSQNHMLRE